MLVTGIDGCRGGWIAFHGEFGNWSYRFDPNLDPLIEPYEADVTFIDMPIGLSDKKFNRTVDSLARKELSPGKTSSVFTPPCREALTARSYREALAVNRRITGKGISIQAWNIVPKIAEVDSWIQKEAESKINVYEAHPEICLKYLNGGNLIPQSKRTAEGYARRLALIKEYDPHLGYQVERALSSLRRNIVGRDDIVDSALLGLSAYFGARRGVAKVSGYEEVDSVGLAVRVGFGRPAAIT